MDVPSQRRHDTHCLLLNVFSYWGVSEHVKSPQTDIFIGPQIFWCFPPTFSEKPMHITASWSVISHAIPMKSHEILINPIISKSWRMFHDHPLVTRKTNGGKKKQAAANQISLLNLNFLIFDRICWFKKKTFLLVKSTFLYSQFLFIPEFSAQNLEGGELMMKPPAERPENGWIMNWPHDLWRHWKNGWKGNHLQMARLKSDVLRWVNCFKLARLVDAMNEPSGVIKRGKSPN